MLIIKVENGNIEKALKTFKHKVNNTKQTKKLRTLQQFEKPSQVKRKQLAKAKYLQSKQEL
jgi:small subunit ribosomal protein S21